MRQRKPNSQPYQHNLTIAFEASAITENRLFVACSMIRKKPGTLSFGVPAATKVLDLSIDTNNPSSPYTSRMQAVSNYLSNARTRDIVTIRTADTELLDILWGRPGPSAQSTVPIWEALREKFKIEVECITHPDTDTGYQNAMKRIAAYKKGNIADNGHETPNPVSEFTHAYAS